MPKSKTAGNRVVQLTGTGPLSFELKKGAMLAIKKILPSNSSRPTIGSGFKTSGYVVYNGITKVGRISPKDTEALDGTIPSIGKVVEVDGSKNILRIELPKL